MAGWAPQSDREQEGDHLSDETLSAYLDDAIEDEAERGRSTIITRRGRAVAAIVPASQAATPRQLSFTAFAGSGKGLWGRDAARRARTLRDEWSR